VEPLFFLLLKQNVKYLPFSALQQVIAPTVPVGTAVADVNSHLSPLHAILLFGAYMLGGWTIAWVLFLRRDAN